MNDNDDDDGMIIIPIVINRQINKNTAYRTYFENIFPAYWLTAIHYVTRSLN